MTKPNGLEEGVTYAISGFDSKEAWAFRDRMENSVVLLRSISGQDSDRAWLIRKRWMEYTAFTEEWGASLAGLDSLKAWKAREQLSGDELLVSLSGLETPRAWGVRRELLRAIHSDDKRANNKLALALLDSLVGCDSEDAWEIRGLLRTSPELLPFSHSLSPLGHLVTRVAGLDSENAWDFRNKFISDFGSVDQMNLDALLDLGKSLIGVDSARAWELREKLKNIDLEAYYVSLAGVYSDVAIVIRQEAIDGRIPYRLTADGMSINGKSVHRITDDFEYLSLSLNCGVVPVAVKAAKRKT
jgi:hypothetical protein